MKRLLAYFILILCLGLTFNVNAQKKVDTEQLLKKLTQLYKDGVFDKSQFEKAKKRLLKSNNIKTAKKVLDQTKSDEDRDKLLKNLIKLYNDGVFDKSQFDKAKKELFNTNNTKIAKTEPSQTQVIAKTELNKIINKIEKIVPGDYYLFGHSTTGEIFLGSTKARSQTTQI